MTDKAVRVIAVHKERYELQCEREFFFGKLKTGVYLDGDEAYPTVGDYVDIIYNGSGDSLIKHTHERKTYFVRLDPDKNRPHEQAIASNFDTVFIMQSLNSDFNPRRIERYLSLSWQSRAVPVIVLTKADLIDDPLRFVHELESIAFGVDVIYVSVRTGVGLERLEKYLEPGMTAVLLGSSGVGKSSLINTLLKEEVMKVREIRKDDSRGRHTTTHRQLVMLDNGACIIDTPGMRELGLFNAIEGVEDTFTDIEALAAGCRFSDCRHNEEPGCAVMRAIKNGELTKERWNSYIKLKREAVYFEKKTSAIRGKTGKGRAVTGRYERKNGRSVKDGNISET